MSKILEGKVAIVTSGASGLGKAISKRLVEEGCAVVMAQRRKSALDEAVKEFEAMGGKAMGIETDISNEQQVIDMVETTVKTYGRLDILVNNTGVAGPICDVRDMELKEWNDAITINLTGTMLCCRETLKYMCENGGGSIVMMGAEVQRLADGWGGFPTRASYMATKLGINALQATIAVEAGPYGVRVNTVSPSAVKSDRMMAVLERYAEQKGISVEEEIADHNRTCSLRRLTQPEDVAECCLFLASDAARAITNQVIGCSSGLCHNAANVKK